ncbi:MAG: hypothetical protein HUU46_04025 [Candidatus Hydrogenedentes bacterium]|nr:hypothetical protein [Candidatus Hydrogenedentota bacterium]
MSTPVRPQPKSNRKSTSNPATEAWEHALDTFRAWVGPVRNRALETARQRYFAFCQTRRDAADFPEVAPMIAFGFLTRCAFADAERKTDMYGRR